MPAPRGAGRVTAPRLGEVARSRYLALDPDTPIREAAAALVEARCAAAPVVDAGGTLLGILTAKDCFRPAMAASYYQSWTGTVADAMAREVETLDAGLDIVAAAEAILASPHRAFPVLRDGALAGMVERDDLLAAFLREG
jgi:CBS domain-containing protein